MKNVNINKVYLELKDLWVRRAKKKKLSNAQKELLRELNKHFKNDKWPLRIDYYIVYFKNMVPETFYALLISKGYKIRFCNTRLTLLFEKAK